MSNVGNDLRYSIRNLISKPAFSVMTILMLALGIGACTAIFTVLNAVLLRPLPYPNEKSLVQLWELSDKGRNMRLPEANFMDWKAQTRSFEGMAMFGGAVQLVAGGAEPIRARIAEVSRGFFDILNVPAMIGTTFQPDHLRADAQPSIVVSYALWQRMPGGDSIFRNKTLTFQDKTYTVIGVMPPGFGFPPGAEAWISRENKGLPVLPNRSAHNWSVLARLKPGVSFEAASSDVNAIAARIHKEYSNVTAVGGVAVPLKEQLTQSVGVVLPILFAAVSVLLLIACANVSNLILVHATDRQQEVAVRLALGASRYSLVRLFLCETLLLTGIGAIFGTLLSAVGVKALLRIAPNLPRIDEIGADWEVLAFVAGLCLVISAVLGTLPAIRSRRISVNDTLKQAGRSQAKGVSTRIVRQVLLVSQVALTVMLLVGAGLLGRSLVRVLQVDLGFQTESRIALDILLPRKRDLSARQRDADRYEQLLSRISTIPAVIAVGGTEQLPLTGSAANGQFRIEGGSNSGAYWPIYHVATAGYFQAIDIPILRGRVFDESDGATTPEVAVISKTVADTVWPGQDPIGRRINFGNFDQDPKFMTIIGIVADVRNSPDTPPLGEVYVHYLQRGSVDNFSLVIHASGQPESIARVVMSEIRSMNPEASIRVQTLGEMFSSSTASRRFNFTLLAVFAGSALMLAMMGVYSAIAYSVVQRNQEIGIRLALGAPLTSITRLFVAEGVTMILFGSVIGLVGAAGASRLIQSLLFGVRPSDVPSYILGALPLVVAGLIASLLPARRAAQVDPMTVIRDS
jgi:putative ABC transport system permease protein